MGKDNQIKLRKSLQVLGVFIILLGGYRLVKDFSLFIDIFSSGFSYILSNGFDLEALFLLIRPLWVILFEMFCVYTGINSFKKCTPTSVKNLFFALIVLIVERLSCLIYWNTEINNSEGVSPTISLIIVGLSFLVYRIVAKWLIERFFPGEKFPLFHKGELRFMVMYLYFKFSEEVRRFVPTKEGYDHVHQEPWGMITFVGCIIIIFVFYNILGRVLMPKDDSKY